jgi:hypothetical protein
MFKFFCNITISFIFMLNPNRGWKTQNTYFLKKEKINKADPWPNPRS